MSEVKTAAQKAREILGHEEGCPVGRPITFVAATGSSLYVGTQSATHVYSGDAPGPVLSLTCTCPELPLPVRLAAAMGTLRKEHDLRARERTRCPNCGVSANYRPYDGPHDTLGGVQYTPGPCHPPLDVALAWTIQGECTRTSFFGLRYLPDGPCPSLPHRFLTLQADGEVIAGDGETREEAIARLYLALHDAGLL